MPKSALELSLEEDMKAAGMTQDDLDILEGNVNDHNQDEGDEDDGQEDTNDTGEDDEIDGKAAADRLAKRRAGRKASDEDDAGGSSSDDGGESRGPDGSASDSGKGAQKDGETLQDGELDTSPAGMAKMRRELREAKVKLAGYEKGGTAPSLVEAAKDATKPAVDASAAPSAAVVAKAEKRTLAELGEEPNKDEDLAGYLIYNTEKNKILLEEMRTERVQERAQGLFTAALSEVEEAGRAYTKTQPDYPQAIAHAEREYARAVKVMMPNKTDAEIAAALKKEKIHLAIKCEQEGTNVSEVLYDLAIERFGYNPEAAAGDEDPKPAVITRQAPAKTSLSTVAKNQKRSASPLDGGGRSGGPRITLEEASRMSPLELMNLPPEDMAYLESLGL